MTCPDWRTLVAARDAGPAVELPAWAEARRHAAGCDLCRRAALAADPLLLFARLPERAVTPADIADMQSAVSSLVRASRVGSAGRGGHPLPESLRAGAAGSGARSIARVAAVLGVCSLLALSGAPRPRPPVLAALASGSGLAGPGQLGTSAEDAAPLGSVVEELDRPGARIYELPQSDMAVVMIVDASLDV